MSIKVMSLVWDNFNRGGSEKLAMLALADWCNDQGGSLHPSIKSIAEKINVSESQARRIVHGFIDDGYLTVVGNSNGGHAGQTRQYVLNVEKLKTPSMDATRTPSINDTPSIGATPSMDARTPLASMRDTPSTHDTLTTIEPSLEPPLNTPKKIEHENLPIPSNVELDIWNGFLELRKSIKAKNSAIAIKALITQLNKLVAQGFDPNEIVLQSIRASWKDLYPIKNSNAAKVSSFKTVHDKRSETAKAMFGGVNHAENGRIIDVSDADIATDRPLISANG